MLVLMIGRCTKSNSPLKAFSSSCLTSISRVTLPGMLRSIAVVHSAPPCGCPGEGRFRGVSRLPRGSSPAFECVSSSRRTRFLPPTVSTEGIRTPGRLLSHAPKEPLFTLGLPPWNSMLNLLAKPTLPPDLSAAKLAKTTNSLGPSRSVLRTSATSFSFESLSGCFCREVLSFSAHVLAFEFAPDSFKIVFFVFFTPLGFVFDIA
mmetsp:Transcript_73507/g.189617  ORF Transcript_73507/g.189617 Transcript_73507/m.189617 type:complete len:205 (+) Transcript_73507:692-1306(+)